MEIELSGHYGYRRILRSMAPMILMMMVISIYSIVDGWFISNYAGSDAFAGMNLIWPPIALVGALGMMFGTGGSALVSKTFGEGNSARANGIFSMLIVVLIITSVILAAVLYISMPQLARILGSDDAMLPHAIRYGRILSIALPFYMLQVAFQPFFMVAEKPHFGTALSIGSGVTNIVLDAVFVAGFGWGLTGAAIASSLSLVVGGGVPLLFFSSSRNHTQLRFTEFKFDRRDFFKSCSNGLSEFVSNISFNIIGICYNWQLMRLIGSDGVSAYGIILYLGFIFSAVFIGYNMGISQVISFNYGADNREELKSLLRKSLVIISVAGLALTAGAELSAEWIARVFVGYDEALVELTGHATRVYMLSFLICGFNMFVSAWFTALNNGVVSAVAAFVRTMVLELACIFILPVLFGDEGIWMAVNIAEILTLILSIILILAFRKRYGY